MLELKNISVQFGGIKALNDISFKIEKESLFSIIGPNGAGKTSLLNVISGRYKPKAGNLLYKGHNITGLHPNKRPDLGIGRTFQNLALFNHMTVLENIYIGRHHLLRSNFLSGAFYWVSGAKNEEVNNRKEAEKILDFLEISNVRKSVAGTLSYGLRKRVELARAIAIQPELILLDEPMAGMNLEEKEDMARFIIDLNREWKITVVMIEHDMGVVMDISKRIAVLDFGEKIAEGTPDEVIKNKRVQQAYLGDEH
ncbi:MAG: ABC transporter ATP-binding protein [Pelagibacterales bacterium]|nr:ABC transporter ATP-binding protein [Pelagibacterales bacterium]OUU63188.1 MAG: ABC transporter ATP-binding protein [Alphaproteobacteria bacterium TMED62]|tara:strand:- start:2772 stop:3533 length:762 start_codon:yes stop_codon:yes gene_type:complete